MPSSDAHEGVLIARRGAEGEWGYVCDDDIDSSPATRDAVCGFLGYADGSDSFESSYTLPSNTPVWAAFNLECPATASATEECTTLN